MFIPIGDEPNEARTPWVNYVLVTANVLVFLVFQRMGTDESAVARYAYVPAAPTLVTAFTSMFLHGGFLHLGSNMLFLWIFGDNVEARLGSVGYLFAYLATGLAGGMVHGLLDPASAIPSLGASGAISGVMGLYLVAFPRNRVKMLVWLWYYANVLFVPAWVILGLWFIVFQNVLPFLFGASAFGGVAYGAHLGGFAAGVVLCLVLRPFFRPLLPVAASSGHGRYSPPPRPANRAPWTRSDPYGGGRTVTMFPSSGADERDDDVLGLWRAGRREQAADAFAATLRAGGSPSLPEPEFLRLSLWLEENRRFDDARRAFEAFLRDYPSSRSAPLVHFGLGMIHARHLHDGATAAPHLEAAARYSTDAAVREAATRELGRLA